MRLSIDTLRFLVATGDEEAAKALRKLNARATWGTHAVWFFKNKYHVARVRYNRHARRKARESFMKEPLLYLGI